MVGSRFTPVDPHALGDATALVKPLCAAYAPKGLPFSISTRILPSPFTNFEFIKSATKGKVTELSTLEVPPDVHVGI